MNKAKLLVQSPNPQEDTRTYLSIRSTTPPAHTREQCVSWWRPIENSIQPHQPILVNNVFQGGDQIELQFKVLY